jgi:hypothetical protein
MSEKQSGKEFIEKERKLPVKLSIWVLYCLCFGLMQIPQKNPPGNP